MQICPYIYTDLGNARAGQSVREGISSGLGGGAEMGSRRGLDSSSRHEYDQKHGDPTESLPGKVGPSVQSGWVVLGGMDRQICRLARSVPGKDRANPSKRLLILYTFVYIYGQICIPTFFDAVRHKICFCSCQSSVRGYFQTSRWHHGHGGGVRSRQSKPRAI